MLNTDSLKGGLNHHEQERCDVAISVLTNAYENLTAQKITEVYQVEDMILKMIEQAEDVKENGFD